MKADDKHMDCEHTKERLPDWLKNNLSNPERSEIERHLIYCLDCQEEYAANKQLWEMMGQVIAPASSQDMRVEFYKMLDTFKASEKASRSFSFGGFFEKISQMVLPQWTVQLAFSLLLVGLGWVIGNKTSRHSGSADPYKQQIEVLAAQVQEMRSNMMLALIDDPSATERLRAVSYTSDITNADERVIEALFATLNNDSNTNVRLVTLEALTQYASNASVRKGLVKSLAIQDSPMVQVALADLMVKLQEKGSVKTLKTLLKKDDLDDLVKNKLEQTIKDLS